MRRGAGFSYLRPGGSPLREPAALARIRSLAIPPAWTDVWICPDPRGHLQATGRDARGRLQHRYHPRWRELRERSKYAHLSDFGRRLPAIRKKIREDLRRPGLPREKVLALVVRLLEKSRIRVGGEEYARANRSFGLTTMRERHVRVDRERIRFRFRGKSGRWHDVTVRDARLARIVSNCQELPGQELFQYRDDEGRTRRVRSHDVNDWLGEGTTAKDFRTWAGTMLAARALFLDPQQRADRTRANLVAAVAEVAAEMGNTPAVCRKSYIHPALIEAWESGRDLRPGSAASKRRFELAVLALIEKKGAA